MSSIHTAQQPYSGWAAKAIPADAPDALHAVLKRAFYSGMFAAFGSIMNITEVMGDNDEAGASHLEQLGTELEAFFAIKASRQNLH